MHAGKKVATVVLKAAAALSLSVGLLLLLPQGARSGPASHDPWKIDQVRVGGSTVVNAPGRCEMCHTLDPDAGENGTSYISNTARTLGFMKLAKGGAFALTENFGCTFCHSSQLDNATMDDVLTDYESTTVKHPVGRKIDGTTNTNNEYLSAFGSGALADELQCNSCHNTALLTYPAHEGRPAGDPAVWTGTWNKTNNPNALLNVTVAADAEKNHCVNTCHGDLGAGNSVVKPKMGHYGWGGYNGTNIYDPSGNALQAGATATCTVCHDTHTSTKTDLLQDGLDRGQPDPPHTAVNEITCVAVCHALGQFNAYGHGSKVGVSATLCTPCHSSAISHRDTTDTATARRLNYNDPALGNLTTNRSADGFDNDMDGLLDAADPGEATFAYSKTSNCKTCHMHYAGHGSAVRAAACIDCHDPHGDAAAANNNAVMLRSSVYGENTVYTAADRAGGAYYKAGFDYGACDNNLCHTSIVTNLLSDHKGGAAALAQPCADCHNMSHGDPQLADTDGGFLVTKCTACHFAAADVQNWVINDAVDAKISSTEWTAAGHGRTTAYPSGNPGAAFAGPTADADGCAYCHSVSSTHGDGTNPFRLANKGVVGTEADRWNQVCLVCHRTADTGYDPDGTGTNYGNLNGSRNVDDNHAGGLHTLPQQGGAFCWDCHDPHGDTQHYMIHSGDGSALGLGVSAATDGTYGIPTSSRPVQNLDVTAGVPTYSSADLIMQAPGSGTTYNGLCQTCHASGGTGAAYFYRNAAPPASAVHNNYDTSLCTNCHLHTNDFAPSCTECHGDILPTTRGDGSSYPPEGPIVARTSGKGGTVNWAETSATAATVGEHQNHVSDYGISSCASCHTTSPGTDAAHFTNKTNATMTGIGSYGTWLGGALPGNQSVVDDTCANMTCHNSTYGAPANTYRSAANPAYTRYWNSNLNCYSCHAYDGVASAAPRPSADVIATGSHTQHVAAGTYAMACTNCHTDNAGNLAHKNGSVSFTVNFGAARIAGLTGGNYDLDGVGPYSTVSPVPSTTTSSRFCGNLYCHSTGEPRGTETRVDRTTTQWAVTASGDCGSCHAVDGVSGTMLTNVHETHTGLVALGRYAIACATCHATVVNGTPAIISTTLHVNNSNNVAFAANEGTYGAVAGDCTATYCHSRGLDWTAAYAQGVNAPQTTPDWDTGSAGCNYCHGDASVAYPNYANNLSFDPGSGAVSKRNSHAEHSGFSCSVCHSATVDAGNAIIAPGNHANKVWNVVAGGTASFTLTPGTGTIAGNVYTPASCTTINCHSGGNATWGLPLVNGCFACHTGAETGAAKPSGAANGVANPVVLADYNATGHGRTGTNYPGSNNPPAGYTYNGATNNCYDCHDAAASHAPATSAADPYRLGVYATNTVGVCDKCHLSGPATKINMQEHTRTIIGSTRTWPGTNYNFKCVDCHDPHGDANYQMVRSHISAPSASTETAGNFGSNSYGTPFDSANASAVTFTSTVGFGVGSYGISGSGDGICEVCHNQTNYFRRGVVAVQTHNTGTQCTNCHTHSSGFDGGSCFSCHGNGTTQYWPDGAGNDRGTTAYTMFDNDGEHTAHLTAMALKLYNESLATLVTTTGNGTSDTKQKAICGYCHLLGDGDHTSLSNATQAEVFPAGGNKSLWGAVDNAAFSAATYNCTVTDCHNNKDTTPTYTWYAGAASACIMCHLDIPTDTTHVAHSGAPSANYGNTFGCDTCHYPTTWVTTPTAPATGHINGSWTMEFTYPPASWAGIGYNGSWSTGLHSSCGTGGINPCHRADLANNPPLRATYSWGTALTDDCASCHAGTAIATNKHAQHLGSNALPLATALTFNTSDECGACHNQTTVSGNGRASGNQHIDNSLDVSFRAASDYEAVGGTGSTGSGAARTCSDIRCHNGVTTPGWNATINCGQCHNTAGTGPLPSAASVLGSHAQHANNDAVFDDCNDCHPNANSYSATGGHVDHQNLAVNLTVVTATYADNVTIAGDAGGVNYLAGGTTHTDNGTCTFTSGCHNAAAPVWGGTLANGCFDCHAGAETGAAKPAGAANSAPNPVVLADYNATGHGRTGTNYPGSNNPPAGYTYNGATNNCYDCHDAAATHSPATSGADPYRLGVYATNTVGVCDKCHLTGPATRINMQEHTRTIIGSTRTWPGSNYNFKCVDCHDPHGDANYQMVRSHISAPSASTETAGNFGSNSYGTPLDTANASAVTFTSTTGYAVGSYGISGSGDGICEVCHNQTNYFRRGVATVQTHNTGVQCTNCHTHSSGFDGGSCFSCHGNGTTQYWPDGAGNDRGTTAYTMFDNDGEHTAHLTAMALKLYNESLATLVTTTGNGSSDTKQKAICGYCHLLSDGDHTSLSNATQAEVFPAGGNKSLWGAVDNAAFSAATYNCTVTDCHNNKDTTPTYTWYAGTASACIMCHVDIPTDTSHVAHSGAPSANYGNTFSCDTCHYPTTWVTTPTAPATGHINGSWTMEFTYPPASWAGVNYNGSWSTGLHGSCGAGGVNPCHRANLSNAVPVRTYSWGTALADDCASCHAGTAIATNKHAQHLASNSLPLVTALTFNTSDECGACHNQTTVSGNGRASGNQHIDNSLDVSFRAASDYEAVGGTGSTGSGAARTCSDIRCHNGVTTPGWNATINCGQCHNTAGTGPLPSAASVLGSHAQHANNDAVFDDCNDCHPNANSYSATGGHVDHQNLAVNLTIVTATYADNVTIAGDAGGVNYLAGGTTHTDNGTCTFTSGCHGTGSPVWGGTLVNGCFDCHTGVETGAAKPAGAANGSPNPVVMADYNATGHGRTGTNYPGSNNPPAGYTFNGATNDCYDCHAAAAQHWPAAAPADPYRLGAFAADTLGLCDQCHLSGPATRINMQEHTRTITGSTRTWPNNYNFKCVDCHDPHGDANYQMVRSHISAPSSAVDPTFGSDSFGTPADSAGASPVTFTSTAGFGAGSYGISGSGDGICEVCHNQTNYFRRGVVAVQTHNTATQCMICHDHKKGFTASCESCHDATPYVQGAATAPNVMGDGVSVDGTGATTPRPYDDGSYGYNVNGHGRDDSTSSISHGNPIAVECSACHDVNQPAGTHLNGVLNGRLTPSDTRTANSFHLLPGFVIASPGNDWDVQTTFDNYCWTACHNGSTADMRHALDTAGIHATANVAEFGQYSSYPAPINTPPPEMFYDRNLKNAATFGAFDGAPNYALCVSCHNPHGTNVSSPRADLNNKMAIFRWNAPAQLCAQCH